MREIRREIENERFDDIQKPVTDPCDPEDRAVADRPFFTHLSDAIRVNTERARVYAALTGGRSLPLSEALIRFERRCMIPAGAIDRWAAKFRKNGIGIIADDFVSMNGIDAPELPPVHRGRLSAPGKKDLERLLKRFRSDFMAAVFRKEFLPAAGLAAKALAEVEAAETREGCHLAMVRHFLESLGYGALNAVRYARESGGKTLGLSKTFLLLQALPLKSLLWYDLEAQKIHRLGVGILVNDLPRIPFKEAWKATK